MDAGNWLTLVALVFTFIVAPLFAVVMKVYRIETQVQEIKTNHIPHLEGDIKRLQQVVDKLWSRVNDHGGDEE